MDRLDDMLGTAGPLLRQVDDLLSTAGAPAEHPVWRELRRVRLLPGAAAHAVASLRPATFADVIPELRAEARACAETADDLPGPGEWTGDAADAYEQVRRRAAAELTGGDESLDERLEATADLAEALADWMTQTRSHLTATLATIVSSAEAVMLSATQTPPTITEATAAADLATHVLRTIADDYADATDLLRASRDLATAVPT